MPATRDVLREGDLEKAVNAIVEQYDIHARRAAAAGAGEAHFPRVLVAVAGRPGSGKSTVVDVIAAAVRAKLATRPRPVSEARSILDTVYPRQDPDALGVEVCVMPMDGYHLYRWQLDKMPDPEKAHRCRGAEWTFNPEKMSADLAAIATPGEDGFFRDVAVPSFDHGHGDPVEKDIVIKANASIVIVEGNYVLYRTKPEWAAVCAKFDLKIFLACPKKIATERLCKRHMKAWNIPREQAMVRARGSDSTNGDLVDTTEPSADLVIHSRDATESKI